MPLGEPTFPLVPRFRLLGLPFGAMHSARRGLGSDVAGSRPYRRGDDIAAIDWAASARLSSARDADEFVVRERFAEEAPRVVVVCDRRPTMALYPRQLPWLSKPRALEAILEAIARSVFQARGFLGYLDFAHGDEPFWSPPQSHTQWQRREVTYFGDPDFAADADNVAQALAFLAHMRVALPPGTFVFVLSDFLVAPPAEAWQRARDHRWDVVPVIVQDPVWEQSFPDISSVAVPVVDTQTGRTEALRLTRGQVARRREENESRLVSLVDGFMTLGLDPVVVSSSEDEDVLQSFLAWADQRLYAEQEWQRGA